MGPLRPMLLKSSWPLRPSKLGMFRYEPNAKLLALYPAEAEVQDASEAVQEAVVGPERPSLYMQMMTTNSKVRHEVHGWDETQNAQADSLVEYPEQHVDEAEL